MSNAVGKIWKKRSEKAGDYLSFVLNEKNYVAFSNKHKSAATDPDFVIYEGKGRPVDYRSPYERDPGEEG